MEALQQPGIAGAALGLPVFTGAAGNLVTQTAGQARSALDAAQSEHPHGSITGDGKIGSTANLPLFTGIGGSVGIKTAEQARIALGPA